MKKKILNIIILIFSVMFVTLQSYPVFSVAVDADDNVDLFNLAPNTTFNCEDKDLTNGLQFTWQIVKCFRDPIENSIPNLLNRISNLAQWLYPALIALAIAILGISMLGATPALGGRAISLLIKIGVVIMIVNSLSWFHTTMLQIFDEVVTVANPAPGFPWTNIDYFFEKLMGFGRDSLGNQIDLKDGIMGLLHGSVFAKNFGIMLTIIGLFVLFSITMFVIQVVYLYLSSFLTIAFIILIIPIIVPFLLFGYTQNFAWKLLDLYLYSLILPLLMFSFLSIFLNPTPAQAPQAAIAPAAGQLGLPAVPAVTQAPSAFTEIIDNIFFLLGDNYMKKCWHANQPVTPSYTVSSDILTKNSLACPVGQLFCAKSQVDTSAVQTTNVSNFGNFTNYSPIMVGKIDCGLADESIKKDVLNQLILLLIISTLMTSIVTIIPEVARELTRGVTTGVVNVTSPVAQIFRGGAR
ncbi:MAG: type IV secretion system protein [Rickettsiales bacterium]